MSHIEIDHYFLLHYLFKNNNSNQIINYLENYILNYNKEKIEVLLNIKDINGITPFHILFKNTHIDYQLIDYLINNFSLLKYNNKIHPIHYAIIYIGDDNHKIIKLLIENIDINILDKYNNNLYHYLSNSGNNKSVKYFKYIYYKYKLQTYDLCNNFNITPFLYSCINNNTDLCLFLLSLNCNIDIDNNSITPLIYACINNNITIINELLKKNIDINKLDTNNNNALNYCIAHNDLNTIKLLIDNNIDINNINTDNDNILSFYCKNNNIDIDIIKYLLLLPDLKECNYHDILIKNNKDIYLKLLNDKVITIGENNYKYYYLYNLNIDININYIKDTTCNECIICNEEFIEEELLIKCKNKHCFHNKCLIKWFNNCNNEKCPFCFDNIKFNNNQLIFK